MIWRPQETIQEDKYVIQEVLGIGGFGITYRARNKIENRIVAIKTANDLIQSQPDFSQQQEKFVREAFRLAKCPHKNIVELYDIFKEQDLWCIVMEFCSGKDLEQKIIKEGKLSEKQTLLYIEQIGSALIYIHQQGLLHRDVKPSNIMLRESIAEAILIDFGLAREFISNKVKTHTIAISESYTPLEQYQKRAKRGAYTDVYALAATCYFLLTGVQPIPSQFRSQGVGLIPPKKHNPKISDRVNLAIIKGMILEPEKRPQSVKEWLGILLENRSTNNNLVPNIAKSNKYLALEKFLIDRDWHKADLETYDLILKVSDRVKEGCLDYESTLNLPCDILQEIDRLWLKYSKGKFGFSIQTKIWLEIGGKIDYKTECILGEYFGWRKNKVWLYSDRLDYTLKAPMGHFPWDGHIPEDELKEMGLTGSYSRWWCCLMLSRFADCQVIKN